MISIAQFTAKITPKLHGASLAKIADVYGKMQEAAGNMRLRTYPPSVIRSAPIQNAIYDRVYNYTCQDDCDPESIVDIRPIGERSVYDANIPTQGVKQFDIKKAENTYTIEYVNGVKTLRLSKCLTARTIVNRCDSVTDGTITTAGDVTDLAVDYLNHVAGQAALSFNLSGVTGQGKIIFDINAIDLSHLLNLGAFFEWLRFPLASALTNVELRWGTDVNNYWYKDVTAANDRAFVSNAWMLLNHQWNTATKVGNPSTSITHVEVVINYTSGTPRNGVFLDNITAALGEVWETLYYSSCLFTDSTGLIWKETPTESSDLIRLDADGINIFMYEFMLTLQQELKGKNMAADFAFFRSMLYGSPSADRENPSESSLYELFTRKYPSQVPARQQTYYEFDAINGEGDVGAGYDDD